MMSLTLAALGVAVLCLLIVVAIKRTTARRELEQHSITPTAKAGIIGMTRQLAMEGARTRYSREFHFPWLD